MNLSSVYPIDLPYSIVRLDGGASSLITGDNRSNVVFCIDIKEMIADNNMRLWNNLD